MSYIFDASVANSKRQNYYYQLYAIIKFWLDTHNVQYKTDKDGFFVVEDLNDITRIKLQFGDEIVVFDN